MTKRWLIALLFLAACTRDAPDDKAGGLAGAGAGGSFAGAGGTSGTSGGAPPASNGGASGVGAGVAGTSGTSAAPVDAGARDAAPPIVDSGVHDADVVAITCPASALAPGDHDFSVQHDGRERTYVLHVPSSYAGATPVPAVFDFHGYGSSGRGQMGASGFAELSDQHGFIAIYPDGIGGSWHVNGCCGQAAQENLDEIAFVRAVLSDVQSKLCIDPSRIYASGISQGGGMAHHVGCLAADVFAAVAPVSSDLRTDPCTPSRPISELSFRGTADGLSPYEGGPVGPAGMQYQAIGAEPTLERWRAINGCTGAPTTVLDVCETYTECMAGTEVTLCSITGGGHILYSNPLDFDLAATAWAMFERQRL